MCLDFANSVDPREDGGRDHIPSFADLVAWSVHANVATEAEVEPLLLCDRQREAFADTIRLREAIYRIFAKHPATDDLGLLQSSFSNAMDRSAINPIDRTWETEASAWLIHDRVAIDAIDLLFSGLADRVKVCAAHEACGWV